MNRWERRDNKRVKKMAVSGKSVLILAKIDPRKRKEK